MLTSSSTYPKEHFLYLRSVSELFALLDSSITNDSVFRNRVIALVEAQKLFRVYPFVPVEYELRRTGAGADVGHGGWHEALHGASR